MRLGSMQCRKECDTESSDAQRVTRAEAIDNESCDDLCLSFVSKEVCGRERGTYVEENGSVSRSIVG